MTNKTWRDNHTSVCTYTEADRPSSSRPGNHTAWAWFQMSEEMRQCISSVMLEMGGKRGKRYDRDRECWVETDEVYIFRQGMLDPCRERQAIVREIHERCTARGFSLPEIGFGGLTFTFN